jgi:hypothetical protein
VAAVPFPNRSSQSEVDLHFLTRPSFHAPNPLRLRHFQFANKTLYRLIGITEALLLDQILVNALGAQPHLNLSANYLSKAFTATPAPSSGASNRNGWF